MIVNCRQLEGVFAAYPESVTSRFYPQKPPSKAKNPVEISLNIHKFNHLSWSDSLLPNSSPRLGVTARKILFSLAEAKGLSCVLYPFLFVVVVVVVV